MVEYEVNLDVDQTIADAYLDWLHTHVVQMLALPGFIGGRLWRVLEPAPPEGRMALCIRYQLTDETALARYLSEFAPAMRADGLRRFGERFLASRRVLAPWMSPLASTTALDGSA